MLKFYEYLKSCSIMCYIFSIYYAIATVQHYTFQILDFGCQFFYTPSHFEYPPIKSWPATVLAPRFVSTSSPPLCRTLVSTSDLCTSAGTPRNECVTRSVDFLNSQGHGQCRMQYVSLFERKPSHVVNRLVSAIISILFTTCLQFVL